MKIIISFIYFNSFVILALVNCFFYQFNLKFNFGLWKCVLNLLLQSLELKSRMDFCSIFLFDSFNAFKIKTLGSIVVFLKPVVKGFAWFRQPKIICLRVVWIDLSKEIISEQAKNDRKMHFHLENRISNCTEFASSNYSCTLALNEFENSKAFKFLN